MITCFQNGDLNYVKKKKPPEFQTTSGGIDRHKGVRHFASGASKRKASKEHMEREANEITKTRRMTE